jgi:hypothetical protein
MLILNATESCNEEVRLMLSELFYRGPAIGVLHSEYAMRGQIDHKAPVQASCAVHIDAPPERVWAVMSDPAAWPRLDSAIHDVEVSAPVGPGTRFRWSNGQARLKSQFAVVDTGRELSWTGVSFGANAAHRHVLESVPGGGTRLYTEESMAGPLLTALFSSAKLQASLERWLGAIKAAAEQVPSARP